jgi:broad specificity phosphatase PhoE
MSTTLLLVRHGATDYVGRAIAGRLPGVSLNEAGRREAERTAHALIGPVHAVYTSPMERTRETAEPIARRFGLAPVVRPGLIEIDFGEWTGLSFAALASREDWRAFNARRSSARIPGGESTAELVVRVGAETDALVRRHPGQRIVLVSHGDVIKAAVFRYVGRPLDDMPHVDIPTGSISTVVVADPSCAEASCEGNP